VSSILNLFLFLLAEMGLSSLVRNGKKFLFFSSPNIRENFLKQSFKVSVSLSWIFLSLECFVVLTYFIVVSFTCYLFYFPLLVSFIASLCWFA
jgi:hypothetical protein